MKTLKEYIDACSGAVFFGGAGVSTESGIPDFRSEDGIYRQKYAYPPETILSRSFFDTHPDEFFAFYRDKLIIEGVRPNRAHIALAELERRGKLLSVVTQNIDGLHSAAGSKRVWELHGSIHHNRCMLCGREYPLSHIKNSHGTPRCECGGIVKPDVVLYEEGLDEATIEGAVNDISRADLLIIGGTSLNVYPAAGLIRYFRGDALVLINKTPTSADNTADLVIRTPIGEALADAVGI